MNLGQFDALTDLLTDTNKGLSRRRDLDQGRTGLRVRAHTDSSQNQVQICLRHDCGLHNKLGCLAPIGEELAEIRIFKVVFQVRRTGGGIPAIRRVECKITRTRTKGDEQDKTGQNKGENSQQNHFQNRGGTLGHLPLFAPRADIRQHLVQVTTCIWSRRNADRPKQKMGHVAEVSELSDLRQTSPFCRLPHN